jgi:hypothetical protein
MAVLTGSCLSHVPDRAIVVSSAPMMSAQIAKYMESNSQWPRPIFRHGLELD